MERLARAAHGFVAADLAALCSEAAMTALRRVVLARSGGGGGGGDGGGAGGDVLRLCVTWDDFQVRACRDTRVCPGLNPDLGSHTAV